MSACPRRRVRAALPHERRTLLPLDAYATPFRLTAVETGIRLAPALLDGDPLVEKTKVAQVTPQLGGHPAAE
jgi:hypothetical protein